MFIKFAKTESSLLTESTNTTVGEFVLSESFRLDTSATPKLSEALLTDFSFFESLSTLPQPAHSTAVAINAISLKYLLKKFAIAIINKTKNKQSMKKDFFYNSFHIVLAQRFLELDIKIIRSSRFPNFRAATPTICNLGKRSRFTHPTLHLLSLAA